MLRGNFQKLITLELNGSGQLTNINIIAPGLKFLSTDGCTKLQRIQTQSLVLQTVSLSSCITLQDEGIKNFSAYAGSIKHVLFGSTKIAGVECKEAYPFLMSLDLKNVSNKGIALLQEKLNKQCEAAGLTPDKLPPQIKEAIFQYLKLTFTCVERFDIASVLTQRMKDEDLVCPLRPPYEL